ncbi:MAG: hypothetical protein JWR14_3306, partial [Caballeronia sp.]|nr:hypothetical protein [Caballeronia sp.]
ASCKHLGQRNRQIANRLPVACQIPFAKNGNGGPTPTSTLDLVGRVFELWQRFERVLGCIGQLHFLSDDAKL